MKVVVEEAPEVRPWTQEQDEHQKIEFDGFLLAALRQRFGKRVSLESSTWVPRSRSTSFNPQVCVRFQLRHSRRTKVIFGDVFPEPQDAAAQIIDALGLVMNNWDNDLHELRFVLPENSEPKPTSEDENGSKDRQ